MTDSISEVKNMQSLQGFNSIQTENSRPKSVQDKGKNKQSKQENSKEETNELGVEEIENLKANLAANKAKVEEIATPECSKNIANLLSNIYYDLDLSNDEKDLQDQIVENSLRENEITDEQKEKALEIKNKVNERIQNRKKELSEKNSDDLTDKEKQELETINKYEELQKLQEEQKEIEEKINKGIGKTEVDQKKLDELKKLNEEEKGDAKVKVKEGIPPQVGLVAVGPLVALIGVPPFSLIGLLAIMKILPMFTKKKMEQEVKKGKKNNQEEQKNDEPGKETAFGHKGENQEQKTTAFGNGQNQETSKKSEQKTEQSEQKTTTFGHKEQSQEAPKQQEQKTAVFGHKEQNQEVPKQPEKEAQNNSALLKNSEIKTTNIKMQPRAQDYSGRRESFETFMKKLEEERSKPKTKVNQRQ